MFHLSQFSSGPARPPLKRVKRMQTILFAKVLPAVSQDSISDCNLFTPSFTSKPMSPGELNQLLESLDTPMTADDANEVATSRSVPSLPKESQMQAQPANRESIPTPQRFHFLRQAQDTSKKMRLSQSRAEEERKLRLQVKSSSAAVFKKPLSSRVPKATTQSKEPGWFKYTRSSYTRFCVPRWWEDTWLTNCDQCRKECPPAGHSEVQFWSFLDSLPHMHCVDHWDLADRESFGSQHPMIEEFRAKHFSSPKSKSLDMSAKRKIIFVRDPYQV